MTRRQTGAKVTRRDNRISELQVVHQEDDTPLPPAEELGKLLRLDQDYQLDKSLLNITIDMVKEQNASRRARENKVDWFVFIERMVALLLVLVLTLSAFYVSYLLALAGHEWTAAVVSGGTLVLIISAILKRK